MTNEPETKPQSTVWVFEEEPNRTKVVCGKIISKQMVACFFCKTGHVATAPLEHRRPVNAEWYTTICLPKVFGEIWKTKKRRGSFVHHYIASSHISAQTSTFLTCQNVEFEVQPDLALNNFFYCLTSRKKCVVNDFRRQKMLLKRFKTMFLPQSEWRKCCDNCFECMQNHAG